MNIQIDKNAFKQRIWQRAYIRHLDKIAEALETEKSDAFISELMKKQIFFGIKRFGRWTNINRERIEGLTDQDLEFLFEQYYSIVGSIRNITPNEFIQLFPIDKIFDGEKFEMIDYSFTMDCIHEHGINNPIDEPIKFLVNYLNRDVRQFVLANLAVVDELERRRTGISMLDEFLPDELYLD